jgi:hypothetical protein
MLARAAFIVIIAAFGLAAAQAAEQQPAPSPAPSQQGRAFESVRLMKIRGFRDCRPGFAGIDYVADTKGNNLSAVRYRDRSRNRYKEATIEPGKFDRLRRLVAEWNPSGPKVQREPTDRFCGFRLSIQPNFEGSSFDWDDEDEEIPRSVAQIEAEMNRLLRSVPRTPRR